MRGGEDLASSVGVGGDDGWSGAEGESHELGGGSGLSHGSQRAVSQAPREDEEAAEDWEAVGPRDWGSAFFVAAVFPGYAAADGKGPSEERDRDEGYEEREDHARVEYGFGAKKCWQCEDPPA